MELFGLVPLTEYNLAQFFTLTREYNATADSQDPFYITYSMTVTATTGYDLVNIRIAADRFGTIIVPGSGSVTVTARGRSIRGGILTEESITAILNEKAEALLWLSVPPEISSVSGYIRMSKAEADRFNSSLYQSALADLEKCETIPDFEKAYGMLYALRENGWPVSAETLQAGRKKRTLLEAAEKEQVENGLAETYALAGEAMDTGNFEEAIRLYTALKQEGYADSAERLEEAESAMSRESDALESDYRNALALAEAGDLSGAEAAFRTLSEAGYADSSDRLDACVRASEILDAKRSAYEAGIAAEKAGQWDEALSQLFSCRDWFDAGSHIAACLLNSENTLVLPPYKGGFFFTYKDRTGYVNLTTGELRILSGARIILSDPRSTVYWEHHLCCVSVNGNLGLMDAAGNTVLEPEWAQISCFCDYLIAENSAGQYRLFRFDGSPLSEGEYRCSNSLYDDWLRFRRTDGDGADIYFLPDGRALEIQPDCKPVLSDDGLVYLVRITETQEILLSPDGSELLRASAVFHDFGDYESNWEQYHIFNGVIAFRENGKWGLWDTVGNRQLMKPAFSKVYCFTGNGTARFEQNRKYGIFSSGGKILLPAKYDNMNAIKNGMARVWKKADVTIGGKKEKNVSLYGIVSDSGKEIIPLKYLDAGEYDSDAERTWVAIDNGTYGKNTAKRPKYAYYVMDRNGKKVFSVEKDITTLYSCRILSPSVWVLPTFSITAHMGLYRNTGEVINSDIEKAQWLNNSFLIAYDHINGLTKPHCTIYDGDLRMLMEFDEDLRETEITAVSTDEGHLLAIGEDRFRLLDPLYRKWSAEIPEAHPEPAVSDILRAVDEAGLL